MKYNLTLALFFSASAVGATDDYPAEIRQRWGDAQASIERSIDAATELVVEAVVSREERRAVWATTNSSEIRALKPALRLKLPQFQRRTEGGQEVIEIVSPSCFCHGQLWITLKAKDAVLLTFLVHHGRSIGAENVIASDVEEDRFAEFYNRMMVLADKARATARPSSAAPRPRHP